MSRIGSMVKQVTRQVEHKASSAKQEVGAKASAVVEQGLHAKDSFEPLYDAGANKPGRTTFETTLTRGTGQDLSGTDSAGRPYEDKGLLGFRAHGFAQKAQTVASVGGDVFLGAKHETLESDSDGTSHRSLQKFGAEAGASAFGGTVIGAKAAVQLES